MRSIASCAGPVFPAALRALLETRRFREWPLEDTATLTLDLNSGSAHIYLTWSANERSNQIEIEGEQGRINVVDDSRYSQIEYKRAALVLSAILVRRIASSRLVHRGGGGLSDGGVGGGKGNLDEAVLCARLIDLAQRSNAAGGARLSFEG